MKINGKKISGANIVYIVIPRGDGDNIAFTAKAVLDTSEFNRLVPVPEPKRVMKPGGMLELDPTDTTYQARKSAYANKKWYFVILKSLEATEGLEWETINMVDSDTWLNFETELKDSGFVQTEIDLIISGVMEANALSEAKLIEARNSFLALRAVQLPDSLSQTEEQLITPSGGLVSVLESTRQK